MKCTMCDRDHNPKADLGTCPLCPPNKTKLCGHVDCYARHCAIAHAEEGEAGMLRGIDERATYQVTIPAK